MTAGSRKQMEPITWNELQCELCGMSEGLQVGNVLGMFFVVNRTIGSAEKPFRCGSLENTMLLASKYDSYTTKHRLEVIR